MVDLPQVDGMAPIKLTGTDEDGMFRSAFGEPKPRTYEQLLEALQEQHIDTGVVVVEIMDSTDEPEDSVFNGWTAEIRDEEDFDKNVCTAGFPDKETLMAALIAVRIPKHRIEVIDY